MVWLRHLLFIALCIVGLSAIAANLLWTDTVETPQQFAPDRYQQPKYQDVITRVDDEFEDYWAEQGLESAERADALTVIRRLSLGLTGTIPSLEEIRVLEEVPEEQRVEWWLSHLFEDRRYHDYAAERLARAYVGADGGPFLVFRRRRFVTWLSDELEKNTPYDELVRKLISDAGIWTDKPAVNFVTVTLDENNDGVPDPIRLAGRTSRAFLGMRIDCLQCHDDRLGNISMGTADKPRDGLQSDFHRLAAFFGQTKFSIFGVEDNAEDRDYKYKYLDAEEEEVVAPVPPFAGELWGQEGTRRQQLAGWVTHPKNKPFARAIVNRVWALLFSRPLVDPVDDIPLHGGYPPGLETLADDLVDNGFDLRRLIRVIAATKAFQLESEAEFEVLSAHEGCWAVFPLTRLRPEQMAGSVIQSASLKTIDAESHIFAKLQRFNEQDQFVRRYGDMGEDEFEDRGGTITQRLLMMNGQLVKQRTQQDLFNNAATKIAQLAPNDEHAIETAYLTVLTRRPTDIEREYFLKALADVPNRERPDAFEDLFWTLLNGTEFSWNH